VLSRLQTEHTMNGEQTRTSHFSWNTTLVHSPCSRYCDSLRAGRSGDRIPAGVWDFPHQPWSPSSFLYNGYGISFPGVKQLQRDAEHTPASNAEVKERVRLKLYYPSVPSMACSSVNAIFLYILREGQGLFLRLIDSGQLLGYEESNDIC